MTALYDASKLPVKVQIHLISIYIITGIMTFVLGLCIGACRAATIQVLWKWFLTPIGAGPAPSIPIIMGAIILFSIPLYGFKKLALKEDKIEKSFMSMAYSMISDAATQLISTLFVGYILHMILVYFY